MIAPPDSLLIPCTIDKPPSDLSKPNLVKAWISQTTNLGDCNEQLQGIRTWKRNILEKDIGNDKE